MGKLENMSSDMWSPFSGWEVDGSSVPGRWELPPAPTRVWLDPAASPPPMKVEQVLGIRYQSSCSPWCARPLHLASACVGKSTIYRLCGFVIVIRPCLDGVGLLGYWHSWSCVLIDK